MIFIDALYINNGGGKVLLDYLMQELDKLDVPVFYLLDKRIENNHEPVNEKCRIVFQKADYYGRKRFYKKNKEHFSTLLCFGNLPPAINQRNCTSYTYFHQPLFLELPDDMPVRQKIMYWLKTKILSYDRRNTEYWLVQSDFIKQKLTRKYKIKQEKVLLMPFYPPFKETQTAVKREKHSYVFVSNAAPHKNHVKLIDAFCRFYENHKKGVLTITVAESFTELCRLIREKQDLGYPIRNTGFIKREDLKEIYQSHEYLIFPSLAESFGLGLVEAIENGCNIIGADLPYTYEVCEPSITFNPYDEGSIVNALTQSLKEDVKPSVKKITNNINQLITLLYGNTK